MNEFPSHAREMFWGFFAPVNFHGVLGISMTAPHHIERGGGTLRISKAKICGSHVAAAPSYLDALYIKLQHMKILAEIHQLSQR